MRVRLGRSAFGQGPRRTATSKSRDVIAVAVVGLVVSAAPAIWYSIAWPDQQAFGDPVSGWLWVCAASVAPFALLAVLRQVAVMGRAAALVALVACGGLVTLGQVSGLNPHDPSSTASVTLLIAPIYACFVVAGIVGAERIVRMLAAHWHITNG